MSYTMTQAFLKYQQQSNKPKRVRVYDERVKYQSPPTSLESSSLHLKRSKCSIAALQRPEGRGGTSPMCFTSLDDALSEVTYTALMELRVQLD